MSIFLRLIEKPISRLVELISFLFHPRSISRLFTEIFTLLMACFLTITVISSLYFSSIMRDQVYASMKDTMELYSEQISQGFTEALTYLSENCIQNTDVSSLNTAQTPNEIYLYLARIRRMLTTGNYSLSNIGGMFVYSQPQDIYIRQVNESWDNALNNTKCSELIVEILHESSKNGTLDELNLRKWFLVEDGKDSYLVRIIKSRNTYAGAWTNLERISSAFDRFQSMGAVMLYVDEEGNCVGNPDFMDQRLDPRGSLEAPSYYRSGPSEKYLTVSVKLDFCDYYIMALIPTEYIQGKMRALYRLIVFILFWILLFGLVLSSVMNHFFHTPSRILQPVIASMRSGQFGTPIPEEGQFQEIREITGTFNDMIGEIGKLRIHIYEEQLSKKELELQYLKTQLAPHFLINCLNTIFVLGQDENGRDTSQEVIRTLSEHLRYTLSNRTHVSLREEASYVENYLLLSRLRFPGTLTYSLRLEEAVRDAQVFPLLILMLTENSIKANMVMGEPFFIRIEAFSFRKEDTDFVHIIHVDSGTGFDEESLQLYNHILEHPELRKQGNSIGIFNIVKRMKLAMGEGAQIIFSNEQGMGARVDMVFPYVPCTCETEAVREKTGKTEVTENEKSEVRQPDSPAEGSRYESADRG